MYALIKVTWFLIDTLISSYVMILMLRLMMQMVRANAFNPLCQFVIRITTPMVRPLQLWVPGYHGFDFAILVLAFLLTMFKFICFIILSPTVDFNFVQLIIWSSADVFSSTVQLIMYLVVARVILSLLHNPNLEPLFAIVYSLTEPLLGRVRKLVPLIAGYDLSPLFVIIALTILNMVIVAPVLPHVPVVS